MTKKNLLFIYLTIILSMFFWSMSFIWYKQAYKYFEPLTTITLRLYISSIILLFVSFIILKSKILLHHLKYFFLIALFEPFLYFLGESYGIKYVSPVTASVITALIPLLTSVASFLIYGELLGNKTIMGIIISFVGVCIVILSNGLSNLTGSFLGIVLMLFAVLSAVGYALSLRKIVTLYNPITIVAIQNSIGFLLFLPLLFKFESPTTQLFKYPYYAYLPILYLAIGASSLAFIFFAYSVSKIGISRTSIFTNLIPVLTAIFSYYLLNELLPFIKILGIFFVIAGLTLSQWDVVKTHFR